MTDPVTPHLRAIDAIHPEDMAFKDLREAGVTSSEGSSPASRRRRRRLSRRCSCWRRPA
jgi:hypothetical protein